MAISSVVSVLAAAALHRVGRLVTVAADYRTPGTNPSSWHRYSYTQFWERGASTPKNLLHHPTNLPDGQLVDITLEQVLPTQKDNVPADLDGVPFYEAVSGTIQVDESSQEESAPTGTDTLNRSTTQSHSTKITTQSHSTKADTFNKSTTQSQGTNVENQELGIQNFLRQRSRRQELSQNAQNQDQRSLLVIIPIYTDVDPAFQFNPDVVIQAVWDQAAKVFNGSSYGTLVFPKEFGTVAVVNTGAAVRTDFPVCDYPGYVNSILGSSSSFPETDQTYYTGSEVNGWYPYQYDHILTFLPQEAGCQWSGLAFVPGRFAWISAFIDPSTIAHELGHNLGLGHASADTTDTGANVQEYGDPSDVMGSAWNILGFNLPHSVLLGFTTVNTFPVQDLQGVQVPIAALAIDPDSKGLLPHGYILPRVPSDQEVATREAYCNSRNRNQESGMITPSSERETVDVKLQSTQLGSGITEEESGDQESVVFELPDSAFGSAPNVMYDQVKTSKPTVSTVNHDPQLISESPKVADDQVKSSTSEVPSVADDAYLTSKARSVADDQVKTGTPKVPTVLQNSCPSERDHLVLFSGYNSYALVEVNYVISYRGAIGIDDTIEGTFGQVGKVYVHSHATPPQGYGPDNSRYIAVLTKPGDTWISDRSNVSVTLVEMTNERAIVIINTTSSEGSSTLSTTSTANDDDDEPLQPWAIAIISTAFILALAVACIVPVASSASYPQGYIRLVQNVPQASNGVSFRIQQQA